MKTIHLGILSKLLSNKADYRKHTQKITYIFMYLGLFKLCTVHTQVYTSACIITVHLEFANYFLEKNIEQNWGFLKKSKINTFIINIVFLIVVISRGSNNPDFSYLTHNLQMPSFSECYVVLCNQHGIAEILVYRFWISDKLQCNFHSYLSIIMTLEKPIYCNSMRPMYWGTKTF